MDNSYFSLALANSLAFSQELQQQQLLMQQQKQQQTQQQQQQLLLNAQAQYLLAQHAQAQTPMISQQNSLPLPFQSAPFLQLQQQQQQLQPQQPHSNNFFNPNDTQSLMQLLSNSAFLNKTQQQNQQYGLLQSQWALQQQQFQVGSQIPGNGKLIDEQSMNQLILQSQIAQLNSNSNKQIIEAPQLNQYFLQQQQQQQQQLQQQQVLSQLQQLIQQQTQQQAITKMVQEANENAQKNNQFLNQDFAKSFSNPSDSTSFMIKQEVPCLSEKISSFTESPNISATTLPIGTSNASARCSISMNSHSNNSSMGKNFFNPSSSPLFQEPSTSWNLLFKQLQTPQSFPANSSTCMGSFSLDFAKQASCGGFTPAGNTNTEGKSQKAKKKSNPKRNTIKNLGNQIISFMCNKSSLKIIQKIPQIEFEEKEFEEFKKFCEQYKNKMLKIADLRNIWISASPTADERTLKYHKIIRVLSRFYLNNEAVPKLLTSNKLKDRKIHLSIRRILAEKLKDPEQFTTLNQYSKK